MSDSSTQTPVKPTQQFQVGQFVKLRHMKIYEGFRRNYDDAPNLVVVPAGAIGQILSVELRDKDIEYSLSFGVGKVKSGCHAVDFEETDATEFFEPKQYTVDNWKIQQQIWALWKWHDGIGAKDPRRDHVGKVLWNTNSSTFPIVTDNRYQLAWTSDAWKIIEPILKGLA